MLVAQGHKVATVSEITWTSTASLSYVALRLLAAGTARRFYRTPGGAGGAIADDQLQHEYLVEVA
jgi:hypothetical protein